MSRRHLPLRTLAVLSSALLAACDVEYVPTGASPVGCAAASLALSPDGAEMMVGEVRSLSALANAAGCDRAATEWSSSDPDVVEVSQTGLVSALRTGGPVRITARFRDGEANAWITVRDAAGGSRKAEEQPEVRADSKPRRIKERRRLMTAELY